MDASATRAAFLSALANAREESRPFRHWRLRDVLDRGLRAALGDEESPAPRRDYKLGRREEHNPTRRYVDADAIRAGAPARALAETLRDPRSVAAVEARCGISLRGAKLRIEDARDGEGFWLEPHTDIGVKAFTMFVYLADPQRPRDWGTDLYEDAATHAMRVPFEDNTGLIFVPGEDTWHGFEPRPIDGVRRSLIVNYVTAGWRNRRELAWPDAAVA